MKDRDLDKESFFDGVHICLEDVAADGRYTLGYLMALAKSGKLKAFKIGGEWLTTQEWLADCLSEIKQDVSREIDDVDDGGGLIVKIGSRERAGRFDRILITGSVVLVALMFITVWFGLLPLGEMTSQAKEPVIFVSRAAMEVKISDEEITDLAHKFWNSKKGQVAGIFE